MKHPKYKWPSSDPNDVYSEENWAKWPTEKRIAFLQNQYDQLTKNGGKMAKAVGATPEDLQQILRDIKHLQDLDAFTKRFRN